MKKIDNLALSLVTLSLLAFSGCGGASHGNNTENVEERLSFSGVVVDGYIKDAVVFLDLDGNGMHGENEPSTTTDENGSYFFKNIVLRSDEAFIPVVASGGTDIATGKAFEDELKNIVKPQSLEENLSLCITPLTDVTTDKFLQSKTKDSKALEDATIDVASAFGIATEDIAHDPMQDVKIFIKTQELEQIKALIERAVTKASSTTNHETVQKVINRALLREIETTGEAMANISDLLQEVENISAITIPENEKSFIDAQATEIKRFFRSMDGNSDLNSSRLGAIQADIEAREDIACKKIEDAKEGDTLEVVNLDDNVSVREEERPFFDTRGENNLTKDNLQEEPIQNTTQTVVDDTNRVQDIKVEQPVENDVSVADNNDSEAQTEQPAMDIIAPPSIPTY
ncbi:hypothetical protein MNB_SM-5-1098 [hydrothermal vent metagenome]|uniref:Uncharacterized protein n=1 Tax=hydrothermal vent metagenome TaxID=652676 RepID=A0A1W1CYL6_9ZZZZ